MLIIINVLIIAAIVAEAFLNPCADFEDSWHKEAVPIIVTIAATIILVELRFLLLGK